MLSLSSAPFAQGCLNAPLHTCMVWLVVRESYPTHIPVAAVPVCVPLHRIGCGRCHHTLGIWSILLFACLCTRATHTVRTRRCHAVGWRRVANRHGVEYAPHFTQVIRDLIPWCQCSVLDEVFDRPNHRRAGFIIRQPPVGWADPHGLEHATAKNIRIDIPGTSVNSDPLATY